MSKRVKHQRAYAVAAAVLIAFGAAACGDTDDDPGSRYGAPTTGEETPTAAEGAALATDTDDDLGEFLVDNDGMALYLFTPDNAGDSTCYDQCATIWPPLLTDTEDVAAAGAVDATLIGTVERTDGTVQVTYNGHPLYYYEDDDEPGETNGQGVNDIWYVLNPDGSATTDG